MSGSDVVVIVGAGLAGAKAAETLRAEGFEGRIVLVGAEPERPYERPPLSKGYLTGEVNDGDFFIQSPEYYEEQRIELRLGTRAEALHTTDREVELHGGERLSYDLLLIATGALPRWLPVPGADLDGVCYLRSVADARQIRERLQSAKRLAVIGMGFIGGEVAATARNLGLE